MVGGEGGDSGEWGVDSNQIGFFECKKITYAPAATVLRAHVKPRVLFFFARDRRQTVQSAAHSAAPHDLTHLGRIE